MKQIERESETNIERERVRKHREREIKKIKQSGERREKKSEKKLVLF